MKVVGLSTFSTLLSNLRRDALRQFNVVQVVQGFSLLLNVILKFPFVHGLSAFQVPAENIEFLAMNLRFLRAC